MRLHVQYQVPIIQAQIDMLDANLNIYAHTVSSRAYMRLVHPITCSTAVSRVPILTILTIA